MENHRTSAPPKLGKVVVVCELDRDLNDPPKWWRVTLSLPGRSGTKTRTWDTPGARMDQSTYEDLVAWLVQTFDSAILTTTGVQASLLG